jgi:hypothetical protein
MAVSTGAECTCGGWALGVRLASGRLLRGRPLVTVGRLQLPYLRGEVVRETLSIMRECLLALPSASQVAHGPAVAKAGPIGAGALSRRCAAQAVRSDLR